MSENIQELKDYDVFTRLKRGAELIKIGNLRAPNDDIAGVYANIIYDEQDWAEMFIVRQENLIGVREIKGIFAESEVS